MGVKQGDSGQRSRPAAIINLFIVKIPFIRHSFLRGGPREEAIFM